MNVRQTPARAADAKQKLGDELNGRLKTLHGELKMAAAKIGIRYQSLRQDLWQSRFLKEDLLKLCQAVGLPQDLDKLGEAYEFSLKAGSRGLRKLERNLHAKVESKGGDLADVFNTLQGRMDHVRQFVESAKEIIPLFFDCLGPGDTLAIFISDELPTHWDSWITRFAEKLAIGARVIYLHPSNALTTQINKNGYSGMFTPEAVQESFVRFKRKLAGLWPNKKVSMDDKLCCIEHNCPYVCAPRHRYVLYFFSDDKRPQVRSTGTFPIALHHGDVELENPSEFLVVPLNYPFTCILRDACETALQNCSDGVATPAEQAKYAAFLKGISPH